MGGRQSPRAWANLESKSSTVVTQRWAGLPTLPCTNYFRELNAALAARHVRKISLVAFRGVSHDRTMKSAIDRRVGVGGFNVSRQLLIWGLAGLGMILRTAAAAEPATSGETFKLREVSAFEHGQNDFLRGQPAICQDIPFAQVKAYPAFVSKKPIYGSIHFNQDRKQPNSGQIVYFAVDESQGTGKGYDRLYFDANGDLDLRNDPVVAAASASSRPRPRQLQRDQGAGDLRLRGGQL